MMTMFYILWSLCLQSSSSPLSHYPYVIVNVSTNIHRVSNKTRRRSNGPTIECCFTHLFSSVRQ